MKYTLLFSFFLVTILRGHAQSGFSLSATTVSAVVVPDSFETRAKVYLKNTSSKKKRFKWSRATVSAPSAWQHGVVDANNVWSPSASYAPQSVELAPGAVVAFEIYVRPNRNAGQATIDLRIFEEGTSSKDRTTRFVFASKTPVRDTNGDWEIVPNPVVDFFMIEGDGIDKVAVFNIIGRQVKTFKTTEGGRYSLGDLPEGIYIIRLFNANGVPVKTIRLSKAKVKA